MIAWSLALALAIAPEQDEIDAIIDQAAAAAERKDWNAASRALADAYLLDPRRDLLYARAQAERLAGRCNVAVTLYEDFLEVEPADTEIAELARINRQSCLEKIATTPPGSSSPGKGTDAHAAPGGRGRKRATWHRDPAGGVLVALGSVSAVIGGSVLGIAVSRDKKAAGAANEGGFVDRKDAARVQHRVGIAVLTVGSALLVAGVVRWAVVATRGDRGPARNARVRVGFGPAQRGAAVSLGLRF